MNRYIHALQAPSACLVYRPGAEVAIEEPRARVYVRRDEKPDDAAPTEVGIIDTPTMFYVVTKRTADALKGSRNAIKQLRKATAYGVFATQGAADAYLYTNRLQLVAAVVGV
jgi:hypothetical protein